MFFLIDWFVALIYQPFFNLLVAIYLLLDHLTNGNADMGTAVILFTIAFRVLWTPVSLASGRSYDEQQEITKRFKEYEKQYSHDPVTRKQMTKQLFRGNKRIVIFSSINITLQVLIALMLWRIFAKGLEGEDFHLLYPFIPEVIEPFNLTFMNRFDLSHPNMTLNIVQSLFIFVFESISALFAVSISAREVVKTQFTLPVVSFFFFLTMPAGKKLFIITTLAFSIVQMLLLQTYYFIKSLEDKFAFKPKEPTPEVTATPVEQPVTTPHN